MYDDEATQPRVSKAPPPPRHRAGIAGGPDRPVTHGSGISRSIISQPQPAERARRAKWRYWRGRRTLPIWRAILLALGKEPEDRFAPDEHGSFVARRAQLPPRYVEWLERACDHIKVGELPVEVWVDNTPYREVKLTEFAAWWEKMGGKLPAGFPREAELLQTVDTLRNGYPGRPSAAKQVQSEFRRRSECGESASTLKAEAAALCEWAAKQEISHPPTARTIENQIRDEYRRFRNHEIS